MKNIIRARYPITFSHQYSSSAKMDSPYLVLASLGNPGPQYSYTRHNMGHYVNNKLREFLDCPSWSKNTRLRNCQFTQSTEYPVMLYKSESYMNESGVALSRNYQLLRNQKAAEGYDPVLVVIHDELSLPVGKVQVRSRNASPRGHNGLKSIKNSMGGNFLSIAVGIDRPETRDQNQISNYVLSRTPLREIEVIDEEVLPRTIEVIEEMLNGKYV